MNLFVPRLSLRAAALCLLILLGFYARAADLEWHFAHIDDLGVAKTLLDYRFTKQEGLFAVPGFWTYAPFQFMVTRFLVDLDMPYRDLLFWGRLPSLASGVIGLLAFLFFYRAYESKESPAVFPALALLAFSWENVIFAKQMHHYALGVTAAILLLILWIYNLKQPVFGAKRMMANGLGLSFLCHMQYQILFFVPAFFLALFLFARSSKSPARLFRSFLPGAVSFVISMLPLWFFFLSKRLNAGVVNWNRGPNDEYLFGFHAGSSLLEKAGYAVAFFVKNFWIVFQSDTGFVRYQSPLLGPLTLGLLILFAAGVFRYGVTRDLHKRFMGVFFGGVGLTWAVLVLTGKITFSPTRHSLILLPLIIVTVVDGLGLVADSLSGKTGGKIKPLWLQGGLALLIPAFFFASFGECVRERRDPFDEVKIAEILKKYKVEALLAVNETIHLGLMKAIQGYFGGYRALGYVQSEIFANPPFNYETLAWVSHRDALTPRRFEEIKEMVARYNIFRRRPLPPLELPLSAYRLIYGRVSVSGVEIEYSPATKDGANDFYFYILKRKGVTHVKPAEASGEKTVLKHN